MGVRRGSPRLAGYLTCVTVVLVATVVQPLWAQSNATELWIHGIGRSPERGVPLGSRGVRQIINLRDGLPEDVSACFQRYVDAGQGMCLTLRWVNPDDPHDIWEVPPTPAEEADAIDGLLAALSTPEAKAIAPRLWVQFYNEPTVGRGRFHWQDADALFGFASRAAERIRIEAPYIKIAGPSMLKVNILEQNRDRMTGRQAENYDLMKWIVEWTTKYADAASIHLHAPDATWVENQILVLKKALLDQSQVSQFPIVCWEWSASYFPNREDDHGASEMTKRIFRIMESQGILIAAYANYWVPLGLDPVFHWATLVDETGLPNSPFYELFQTLASSGERPMSGGESESSTSTARIIRSAPAIQVPDDRARIKQKRRQRKQ